MNITVVTEPPFEPITLLQVYKQLRLDPDHEGSPGEETHPDDSLLSGYITSARQHVESMTRRSLVMQTLRLSMGSFPVSADLWASTWWSRMETVRTIRLHRPPLVAVDAVRYYDGDNVLQTLSSSSYYVTDDQVPELRFSTTFSSPTIHERADALRVEYRAGYAADGSPPATQADYSANVPQWAKDAILIGVQLLYDDLSPADRTALENMRESMIQPHRIQLAL